MKRPRFSVLGPLLLVLTATLLAVVAPTAYGFAFGDGGILSYPTPTVNGAWTQQTSGTGTALHSVSFCDADNGWASWFSVLLHTTDGGKNWTALNSSPSAASVCALSPSSIVGGGAEDPMDGPPTVALSGDAGLSWSTTSVSTLPGGAVYYMTFADPNNGWLVLHQVGGAYNGFIYHTSDGGATWEPQHWWYDDSWDFKWIESIAFVDASHGWAVGQIHPGAIQSVIIHTDDGGATWSQNELGPEFGGPLMSVAFTDQLNGWAVGYNGKVLHTSDGGQHWTTQQSGVTAHLNGVAFIDSNVGWAVGEGGTIICTSDGGAHWQSQPSGTTQPLYAIDVVGKTAWAVGGGGTILRFDPTPANVPPTANDVTIGTDEGTPAEIILSATDPDSTNLAYSIVSGPAHGTLGPVSADKVTYTPDDGWSGPDEFAFKANDGQLDSNAGTVHVVVTAVDDPPVVHATPGAQTTTYGDRITTITIEATDVDSADLTIRDSGLPAGLSYLPERTRSAGRGSETTFSVAGAIDAPAGDYGIDFTVGDGTSSASVHATITVQPARPAMEFSTANPTAQQVSVPGGTSGDVTLDVGISPRESSSDAYDDMIVAAKLVPLGAGSEIAGTCSEASIEGLFHLRFRAVPTNTYLLQVTVSGGYYTGYCEDVFTVYDPSLGFTTGGGWFRWPGTTDRTNFGFTMKYKAKGAQPQGSVLVIRHAADGSIWKLKGNALSTLSLGTADRPAYGFATITGKATYLQPPWTDPLGGYSFTLYVEDRTDPGAGPDKVWLEMKDRYGNVTAPLSTSRIPSVQTNCVPLAGGNVYAPHR